MPINKIVLVTPFGQMVRVEYPSSAVYLPALMTFTVYRTFLSNITNWLTIFCSEYIFLHFAVKNVNRFAEDSRLFETSK